MNRFGVSLDIVSYTVWGCPFAPRIVILFTPVAGTVWRCSFAPPVVVIFTLLGSTVWGVSIRTARRYRDLYRDLHRLEGPFVPRVAQLFAPFGVFIDTVCLFGFVHRLVVHTCNSFWLIFPLQRIVS